MANPAAGSGAPRASTTLSKNPAQGSGAPRGNTKIGNLAPYDPAGDILGELLNGLNGGWDTAGSGGYMVSQQALRDSLNAAGAQAEADRANVYGQVDQTIRGRSGDILKGYDQASSRLQENAIQRALADRAAAGQREQEALQGAAALGFSGIAPSANKRANAVMEGNIGAQQSIADAWSGFYGVAGNLANERNTSTADAFRYQGLQQQSALQQMLLAALAGAQDYWEPGSGGSSLTPNQILGGYTDILSYLNRDATNDINAAKLRPQTTVTEQVNPGLKRSTRYYN